MPRWPPGWGPQRLADQLVREKTVDLGYGHVVLRTRIQLVLSASKKNVSIQRLIEDARSRGDLIDLTGKSLCRSVVMIEDPSAFKLVLSFKSVKHLARQITDVQ